MKNKPLMIAAGTTIAVVTLGVAGALGLTQVYAQTTDSSSDTPLIIQNLAKAFGVSEDEVQTVFDDTREQRQDEKLDTLVEDGTLTQEQRDALEALEAEHQTKREEIMNSSMTADERREASQALHDELETWADENGVDLSDLRGTMGPRGAGMGGGMRGEEMGDGNGEMRRPGGMF